MRSTQCGFQPGGRLRPSRLLTSREGSRNQVSDLNHSQIANSPCRSIAPFWFRPESDARQPFSRVWIDVLSFAQMSNTDPAVELFFSGYEQANSSVEEIAACYADAFMFGGPAGVQCVKKEDFLKVIPRRKELFRAQGLLSSKISSVESSRLDRRYTLAKVIWNMCFDRGTSEPILMEIAASYILSQTQEGVQIAFQIDHQDLAERLHKPTRTAMASRTTRSRRRLECWPRRVTRPGVA